MIIGWISSVISPLSRVNDFVDNYTFYIRGIIRIIILEPKITIVLIIKKIYITKHNDYKTTIHWSYNGVYISTKIELREWHLHIFSKSIQAFELTLTEFYLLTHYLPLSGRLRWSCSTCGTRRVIYVSKPGCKFGRSHSRKEACSYMIRKNSQRRAAE